MSYQSKYTGEEIDNLLDKVGNGGGNVVTLFDGIGNPSTDVQLSDKISNYDFIYFEAWLNEKSSTPGTICPLILAPDDIFQGVTLGHMRNGQDASIRVYTSTIDSSRLSVGTLLKTGSNNPITGAYLKKVLGIKLGGASQKKNLFYAPLYFTNVQPGSYLAIPESESYITDGLSLSEGGVLLKAGKRYEIEFYYSEVDFNGVSSSNRVCHMQIYIDDAVLDWFASTSVSQDRYGQGGSYKWCVDTTKDSILRLHRRDYGGTATAIACKLIVKEL